MADLLEKRLLNTAWRPCRLLNCVCSDLSEIACVLDEWNEDCGCVHERLWSNQNLRKGGLVLAAWLTVAEADTGRRETGRALLAKTKRGMVPQSVGGCVWVSHLKKYCIWLTRALMGLRSVHSDESILYFESTVVFRVSMVNYRSFFRLLGNR